MHVGFIVKEAGFRVRQLLPLVWSLSLLPLLSGCILGSEMPELAIAIPGKFTNAGPRPHTALPTVAWWRGFHSSELNGLIDEAREANFDIAVAVARVVQADAQSRVAGAPLLPSVSANGSTTRSRPSQSGGGSGGNGVSSAIGGGGRSERDLYRTSLTASYELDFWGKNRAALRAAEETAAGARFDREVVELTTIASVANAYFQALSSADRLRVGRENLTSAERILKLIRQRLSVGTTSGLEVAQQESLVAQQKAALPLLQQTLRQNIIALAVLLGRTPESFHIRTGTMNTVRIPRVTPGLPSEVLTQRPDIREAEANLASANATVESARAAFYPSIQLTGDGGYSSTALKVLFRPESAFFDIAAGFTQPIFDGGVLQGELDLQRGRQEELVQTYRKTIVSSFGDVENALVAIRETALRERLQRDVVSSSRRAFDISEQRLNEGTLDLVTLLNTEQTLFQAQDTLAQARLAHLLAVVSLYQALGGGWAAPPAKRVVAKDSQ
jgi:NodT family efflux transporter outer membrane factor (OMF) lipoprotein